MTNFVELVARGKTKSKLPLGNRAGTILGYNNVIQ